MLPKYDFKTEKGKLILQCLDVVEPNNGRMLYKISLTLENEDVTNKYFGNWHFINFFLENYTAISNDNKWIYILNEGSHFLINTNDLQKIHLPYIEVLAATFIENVFISKYLIILSMETVVIKNLENGKARKLNTPSHKIIFKSHSKHNDKIIFQLSNDETIMFELKELE